MTAFESTPLHLSCVPVVCPRLDITVMQSSECKQSLQNKMALNTAYTHFTISSPYCTLYVAIAHVTTVLECGSLTQWLLAEETLLARYFNHMSGYSVHCAIKTRNCEIVVPHIHSVLPLCQISTSLYLCVNNVRSTDVGVCVYVRSSIAP